MIKNASLSFQYAVSEYRGSCVYDVDAKSAAALS
jgi:hypothetical protein